MALNSKAFHLLRLDFIQLFLQPNVFIFRTFELLFALPQLLIFARAIILEFLRQFLQQADLKLLLAEYCLRGFCAERLRGAGARRDMRSLRSGGS